MKFSNVFFLALLGLFTFSSCGDDDESATDILTSGVWKITESRSDIDGDGDLDDDLESCTRDDEYTFDDDGSYSFDEGATKCDASDPQTGEGTWALSADEKTFTLTLDGIGISADVISITSNRMELRTELFGYTQELVFEK